MKKTNSKIIELANSISNRIEKNSPRFTLFLGAGASISSGIPSYWTLCKEYCLEKRINVIDSDYISAFKRNMSHQRYNYIDTYNWFSGKMSNKKPSIGYYHLANLILKGAFHTIITTNFDNLLELALTELSPNNNFNILIRQKKKLMDSYISETLEKNLPNSNILKLHGDLQTNIFLFSNEEMMSYSQELTNSLRRTIKDGCIIVGSELKDRNVGDFFKENEIHNIYVNPQRPSDEICDLLKINDNNIVNGEDGIFDNFFTDIDLEVHKNLISKESEKLNHIQCEIIEKEGKGVGYINDHQLSITAERFWLKIRDKYTPSHPDAMFFINDSLAPGGMDLMRRLIKLIQKHSPDIIIDSIDIQGNKILGRDVNRQIISPKPDIKNCQDKKILILDAISFSGNTMKIALEQFRRWFPYSDVRGAIMFIGKQLKKDIESFNLNLDIDNPLKDLIYSNRNVTDRHEIFFPWGITQATNECRRELPGIEKDHIIRITKKPWGTIERFTEQEYSSVRILTIEADQKLSFQRHMIRDEFFVALDENVGLEICNQSLEKYNCDSLSSEDIKKKLLKEADIKSLILEKGDCILIPKGIWHRIKASKERVRLLEIAYGVYDEINDIERLVDDYKREYENGLI